MENKYQSGNHFIQTYNGRGKTAGQCLGWRVVFPTKLEPHPSIKYMSFANHGNNALLDAVDYRDKVITNLINTTLSSVSV